MGTEALLYRGIDMVILRSFNSAEETGCCDSRCYEARTKRCCCCCGGRNHGVGLPQAIKNAAEIVKEAKAGNCPERLEQVIFKAPAKQLRLFV